MAEQQYESNYCYHSGFSLFIYSSLNNYYYRWVVYIMFNLM